MSEKDLKDLEMQLKMPQGSLGIEIAAMMNKGNKLMNIATIEQLEIKPDDNILEIGMGNGFFIKNILKENEAVHYIGCDHSEQMVAEAFNCNNEFVIKGQ